MTDLRQSTVALVHELCSAIASCKQLQDVLALLQLAVDSILDPTHDVAERAADHQVLAEHIARLAAATAAKGAPAVRDAFYASSFQELGEMLLSIVAPDWLRDFPDDAKRSALFFRWFHDAPAAPLLRCLSWHLSAVEAPVGRRWGGPTVLPVSADIAADLLEQRFTAEGASGVAEVVAAIADAPDAADDLCALLAGIPDRAALLSGHMSLQTQSFTPLLVSELVEMVDSGVVGGPIAADLICRLAQRGHEQWVAQALLDAVKTRQEPVSALFAGFPASPALPKVLEAAVMAAGTAVALRALVPPQTWQSRADVRLALQDRLLTQRALPSAAAETLLTYLDSLSIAFNDVLASTTWRLATFWGDKSSVQRTPMPLQAAASAALARCLSLLGRARFEAYPGLMSAVLSGVSVRLDSPREAVRRQGMRVAAAMALALDPTAEAPLFADEDLSLLPDERWEAETPRLEEQKKEEEGERGKVGGKGRRQRKTKKGERKEDEAIGDDGYPLTETDSDDEDRVSSVSSSDSEFERYDLEESDDEDPERAALQLRDVVSALKNADADWKAHLRALRAAPTLLAAAPDELTHYAPQLARALLLTRVPDWADEETPAGAPPVEEQRFLALVATTAAAPEPVGLLLAGELYSPGMDVQQRNRALAILSAASQELSAPGSIVNPLLEGTAGAGPAGPLQGPVSGSGRVIRVSERSLAAQRRSSAPTTANRFPPIALKWAAALLRECDVARHGVDLFGRDSFLLGRLLATLGAFLEASQRAPEAAPLAAAVLELIKADAVHASPEPFVRRAALMAAAHAMMAVPPAVVAASLLPPGAPGRQRSALGDLLDWTRRWVTAAAEGDADQGCRSMAEAAAGLAGALATEAVATLAEAAAGPAARGELLTSGPSALEVTIPRKIEELTLK